MLKRMPWEHNLEIIKNLDPQMRYKGGDFSAWQAEARAKLCELLGLQNIHRAENNNFTIEYKKECEGYDEYRFTLEPEENYVFPCVMRVPHGVKAPMPVMLTLQGHSTGMHISLGQPIFEEDPITISGGDRDFVVRAIKEGFAAIAIEQRNFGECGGKPTGGPDCHVSSMSAIINGRTTIGERVVDTMTVIDALDNFDFIDKENIMLMGNSGGGTATFYTAAIDERIKLAMPSCAVCTYKHSIAAMNHCVCNFVPNIARYFDMGDIGGLIAPRKLIVVNGKKDDIFPDEGVRETMDIIRPLYAAAGAPDNCALVTGPEGHRFYADQSWPLVHSMTGK